MIEPCVEACEGFNCEFFNESMEHKCSIRKRILENENKKIVDAEPKEEPSIEEVLATDKWLRELDNRVFGFNITTEEITTDIVKVGKR